MTNPLKMQGRPELADDYSRSTGIPPNTANGKNRPGTTATSYVDSESQDEFGATDADSDFKFQGTSPIRTTSPMVSRMKGLSKVSKSMEQLPQGQQHG